MSVERNNKESESEWKRRREREGEGEAILGIPAIPFDLFVSLKIRHDRIRFSDGFGNVVYTASTKPYPLLLFDSSANPLLSIFRSPDGSWKGFRGNGCGQELLFRVEQTLNTFNKMDFNIFLIGENGRNLAFAMRGCLSSRSCTIYQDKSIVAQMRAILVHHGLHKALEGKPKEFPEGLTDEKWDEIDLKALCAIHLCLSNEVLREVAKEKSAAGLWLKLESLYMTKSVTNRLLLKSRLHDLRLAKDKSDVQAWFQEVFCPQEFVQGHTTAWIC